ncbi:MAG: exodeoxyribonuclease VII large subunit [Bacteroidales bacterium]|nr:exodeoxyribonuclease VII large subunit [Bacteroidales bacterium]MCF8334475.1 exodeoxyribonuclease VII large subunit [Bacteroidales bacterium]
MAETNKKNRKVFTLLDITKSLQSVIRKNYTGQYWVKAEIARLNFYPKSGHCYPDLVHKDKGKIQAEMRSIIWKSDFRRLSQNFREVVKEDLKDGMTILFKATVNFHQKYGLSLNILEIEPAFTLGEMAREKAETIHRLKKEGVFYLNKKLLFPLLPKRIAIISVETSKGYNDFLNIIDNNRWGFKFTHYLFPALLQGDRAIQSISRQLRQIHKLKDYFDLVTIIRGGGGDVGLNSYDDYHLAKQISRFPLPVITGIGHSTNETVVDMVAHANKITPTDLGYFLVDHFYKLSLNIDSLSQRLAGETDNILKHEKERLVGYQNFIHSYVSHFVQNNRNSLDRLSLDLKKETSKRITREQAHLMDHMQKMRTFSKQTIEKEHEHLQHFVRWLDIFTRQTLSNKKAHLESLTSKQRLLDPHHIMKRGYSITTLDGKTLTSSQQLNTGDRIKTFLYDGSFESEIKTINHGKQK